MYSLPCAGSAAKEESSASSQPTAKAEAPPTGVMSKISELIPYNPTVESKDDDDEWDD